MYRNMVWGAVVVAFVFALSAETASAQNVRHIKQGFSIRMKMDNRGVFGRQAYPGGSSVTPAESLGLEYPIGARIEHIFGGGIWVGAKIDTSTIPGTSPRIKAVSTAYEGWSGPLYEMFPSDSPADSFFVATKRDTVPPPGWDAYWAGALQFRPISDQDMYCMYTDYYRRPSGHIPLGIKVIQSSYAWDDPYADAIMIFEYRIINTTNKSIDSAFIGFFFEADVGPININQYYQSNFTGYYPTSRTGYIHNPVHRGSTPVGVSLLTTSKHLDSLKYSFNWYPGPQTPTPDDRRYDMLSSGIIKPDEFPALSDTRLLFGFGPFDIQPGNSPNPDTLKIAVAILSGLDLQQFQRNTSRALDIYLNQGIKLPATPPSPPLRVNVGFRRVELDWKWRVGDDVLYGRPNPEANWDTTSRVARRDPLRYRAPHPVGHDPNIDTTRGGRNFEAYRVWRSEHPDYPPSSFTLLRQFDVETDSFEYNTGLQFAFVDSNLVRGKTYVYSVTSLSIPNLAEQYIVVADTTVLVEVPVEPLESSKRTNAVRVDLPFAVSKEIGKVAVVPNPYRTDQDYRLETGGYEGLGSAWQEDKRVVKFINLPEKCTIRVFSLSGDLIRTIHHDGSGSTFPRGDVDMPLLSESNRALASGIYIFTVDSDFGVETGKFVIIR